MAGGVKKCRQRQLSLPKIAALSYNLYMRAEEKIRLGGMALENGVLVQGPTAWACAIRLPSGELSVVARRKRFQASKVKSPLLRGPARLAEAFAVLPGVRRALPEAQLPFQRPRVRAALLASSLAMRVIRRSPRVGTLGNELSGVALAILPAAVSLRGSQLTAYHGAEHATIGSYEHDEPRTRIHERCGSNLITPMLAGSIVANVLASRLPWRARSVARLGGQVAAVALSSELLAWALAHPDEPLSRAIRRPGLELQLHLATAEPSPAQLEVARAALDACLALEQTED
ncbi:MAG: DUF1385 domain-containing protein [Gaiellaceae bacterium]